MKKVFLSITAAALLAVSITSCNSGSTTATSGDSTVADSSSKMAEETAPVDSAKTETPAATSTDASAPTFENAEVTAYCKEYKAVMDSYVEAAKSKDVAKSTELQKKVTDLGQKSATIMTKVKPEEVEKLTAFMTLVSKQMADAMTPAK